MRPVSRAAAAAALAAALAACGDDPAPAWTEVLGPDQVDRALLSVWAGGPDDVVAVGGGLGNGLGAIALHYDGTAWTEIDTGSGDTLWWVWGDGGGDVYAVGERGRVVRWDGAQAVAMATPTELTLYGIWGAGGDVWAVGGDALADPPAGVILRLVDGQWIDATPDGVDAALFKVWGAAADAVWAVGQRGAIWRWDGDAWRRESCGDVTATLFTVAGGGGEVWAVGGPPAVACRRAADGWTVEDPGIPAGIFNGVSRADDGDVYVVGMGGVKLRRSPDGAWRDDTAQPPVIDLHAVFAGVPGHAYAVGGNFYAPGGPGVVRVGALGHFGVEPPSGELR
ncbi:MAG: hypothetical protein D6689_19325 [Deltaproteobacteria bacterium]|nr:MAG: hypothetical protein D6689_19325 [Deltaproteobacteria bacterium]